MATLRFVSSSPSSSDIKFRIFVEIFTAVILILATIAACRNIRTSGQHIAFDWAHYEDTSFQTGDLLMMRNPALRSLHRGHLAIVIRVPQNNQLFLWDLDNSRYKCELQPLYHHIRHRHRNGYQIYWIALRGRSLNTLSLVEKLRNYTGSRFEYQVGIEYANTLLHQSIGFPGIPVFGGDYKHIHYYCSEAILNILIDIGLLTSNILSDIPDVDNPNGTLRVFYPDNLIRRHDFDINLFTTRGYWFDEPKQIVNLSIK
jgi:hypothetical protein